jgi:tRNA G18 (ribose-2'-O)-methylase SpoU
VPITRVDAADDDRLSDFRAVSDPELATTGGFFIAEGRLVVRRLLTESPFATRAVMVTTSALTTLEDALHRRPDVPVYLVSQELMGAVAGFNIHRGCLASGWRPPAADWRETIAGARRVVVLERVGDADNVGAIFRGAAALNADAVLLGPSCADPLYRKAIRTSMGAALTLTFACAHPWPAALAELAAGGWTVAALTPRADAMPLRAFADATRALRIALVVGHEGEGLSDVVLRACTHRVRIPIHASVDSLNVAMATAIALYEMS